MATVTITEILGGDNIAASRIVINGNFTLLQNAINTLETRLNTSYVPGGSLNVGSSQVLKYNRPVTTVLSLCQGSAQIDGNLTLGTATNNSTLSITGSLIASVAATVEGDVDFTDADSPGNGVFTNNLQTVANSSSANAQWYNTTAKSPIVLTQSLGSPYTLPINDETSVLHLSVTAYTGSAPNNLNTFQMPAVGTVNQGQIVTIVFDTVSTTNGTFAIDNSVNFHPAFTNANIGNNIVFNSTINSTTAKFRGIWLTLAATTLGWKVIGAHSDVNYL